MVARVTDSEVRALIDTDRDTTPFIDVATLLVDTHLVSGITETELLVKIELYLAAHFTAVTEERGGLVRSDVGDETREIVSDVYDTGYAMTRYGQMAMTLDYTGKLADLSATAEAKKSARLMVV